jgi:hypothetical protein
MRRARLARVFWIGAATILAVAALISVVAILGGGFSERDGRILATLGSLLLAGGTAVSGLSLVERRQAVPLGVGAVVGAIAGFMLMAASIWDDFDSEHLARLAGSALVVLLGLLLATTGRSLLRESRLLLLYAATLIVLSIAVLLTVVAIWGNGGSGMGKAIGTFWVLTALGWLMVPIAQRFSRGVEDPAVRVLGQLNGVELVAARGELDGVKVEPPSAGERLFLRRH